jgi:flagellar basal body-associated protein FliL
MTIKAKERQMKKALIIILIFLGIVGGFLYYDWHVKSQKMAAEPNITLYAWTDQNGEKHFTDTQPPRGAKNIEEFKGYEHIKPPFIVQIKHKSVDFFNWIKGKLFKKKDDKKKNKKA